MTHLLPSGEGCPLAGCRAPEQFDSRASEKSAKIDIWALGATLLHMLTGRPPYPGLNNPEIMGEVRRETEILRIADAEP